MRCRAHTVSLSVSLPAAQSQIMQILGRKFSSFFQNQPFVIRKLIEINCLVLLDMAYSMEYAPFVQLDRFHQVVLQSVRYASLERMPIIMECQLALDVVLVTMTVQVCHPYHSITLNSFAE